MTEYALYLSNTQKYGGSELIYHGYNVEEGKAVEDQMRSKYGTPTSQYKLDWTKNGNMCYLNDTTVLQLAVIQSKI